ncbi:MAG: hypothetical protein JW934_22090 [Anaerolineae bacterium]|nr:hypothetical protein [Anaerolineae bacterium]
MLTAFSLAIYIFRHNWRSAVGRAFCIMLTFVMIVYLGDMAVLEVMSHDSAATWLKFQWLGIAFVPASYLHFSDALLNTTSSRSEWRHWGVRLSYLVGGATLLLVILSPWIVRNGVYTALKPRLQAGPLFWAFAVYFFAAVVSGAANINYARRRCLTATSRRRMGYLTVAFVAPALGVFPYMLLTTLPSRLPDLLLMTILLAGNIAVAIMIVIMAYTVAYFGAFTPDRVIKYDLIEYLLRGPLLASIVVVIFLTVPKIETILGLPGDLITLFATVLIIILAQKMINLARPFLNRIVYRQDLEEIAWLQELDTRLLTPSDLEQFLENVLSALAELLRVHHAYVITVAGDQFEIEAACGSEQQAIHLLQQHDLQPILQVLPENEENCPALIEVDGYVLRPLCTHTHDAVLGVLIVERPVGVSVNDVLKNDEIVDLIEQAEVALEDRQVQQGIFVALQQIMPDIERIQKRQRLMRYVTSLPRPVEDNPINNPSFTRWVKDALTHFWGGPKLTSSPLLKLNVVDAAHELSNGDDVQALRQVLEQAIEALRPPGERKMTATEWTLYNILDLKFRQGYRMVDIANRLAISESDLYRKQKTAIAEVSRVLEQTERQSTMV